MKDARRFLRRAAWGNEDPWKKGSSYRYAGPPDLTRLQEDVFHLAIAGYRIYTTFAGAGGITGGGSEMIGGLARLMREPGLVQIEVSSSPRLVPPVSLI